MSIDLSVPAPEGAFWGHRQFHFIGIGGIGMSAIAEILLRLGYRVSGSDLSDSQLLQDLRRLGARVEIGHRRANVTDRQVVVLSSAIRQDNPELLAARQRGIRIVHRADMLAELMRDRDTVTVAGTHGKTTTTSMAAHLLIEAGLDPTVVNGARMPQMGSNARLGKSNLLLAEADESDRSFLKYSPQRTIVTNIDTDHLDTYRDLEDIRAAFRTHLESVTEGGCAIVCRDDDGLAPLLRNDHPRLLTYGLDSSAEISAENIVTDGFKVRYQCRRNGMSLGELQLAVPGTHNVLNSLAAVALGMELDVPFASISEALRSFRGAERRMEWKGEKRGVWVIDDYGHHPNEIRATLEACRSLRRRVCVVYQPHRYSRTKHLFEETTRCFGNADRLFLMDVYGAGEKPTAGTGSARLAEAIRDRREVTYVPDDQDIQKALRPELREGDILLTLGAGNVWKVGNEFLEKD